MTGSQAGFHITSFSGLCMVYRGLYSLTLCPLTHPCAKHLTRLRGRQTVLADDLLPSTPRRRCFKRSGAADNPEAIPGTRENPGCHPTKSQAVTREDCDERYVPDHRRTDSVCWRVGNLAMGAMEGHIIISVFMRGNDRSEPGSAEQSAAERGPLGHLQQYLYLYLHNIGCV